MQSLVRSIIFLSIFCLGITGTFSSALASSWWEVQVIDTMKYSRDLSREKLNDPLFGSEISKQMKQIAETGATHVGIATPYDEEFIPVLRKWVAAARAENLNVWFRGNWSGWEGWFNYPRITREVHIQKTAKFLDQHQDLFEDGDIFSACPECENGGPGDPRMTGDIAGYQSFIIAEHELAKQAFRNMGKNVASNWQSMNADVARAVMDKDTTRAMDGLVVIDHYVRDPKQVARDIAQIAQQSGGKVALGEFGAPIPDLHGAMSEVQQAAWVDSALHDIARSPHVVGVSYWTNMFGSTKLWDDDGSPRLVVDVLKKYYLPKEIRGVVTGEWGKGIQDVEIVFPGRMTITDKDGVFAVPYLTLPLDITISHKGYRDVVRRVALEDAGELVQIQLKSEGFFASARNFLCRLFGGC